jgi:hypothetical protein
MIPLDGEELSSSSIAKIDEAKFWAQLDVDEGRVISSVIKSKSDEFEELSHIVVVSNDSEYVWPFIEQNMLVLVAHHQKSVDDILEAYLFKELNELAY